MLLTIEPLLHKTLRNPNGAQVILVSEKLLYLNTVLRTVSTKVILQMIVLLSECFVVLNEQKATDLL